MTDRSSSAAGWLACAVQVLGGVATICALAAMPPANGAMLLLPITGDVPVTRLALEHGALLLGGSGDRIVVRGARDALWWPLLRQGVLAVAAPRGACGEAA